MPNKFVTFLEAIGHDFKVGLQKLDPFVKEAIVLGTAAQAEVSALDPALGAILKLTVATVSSIEQKFAAMGQQAGTGVQKLAQATTILQPVISQVFSAVGKASDVATVQNYISAVVDFLNAIPASATTPAIATTATQPTPVPASGPITFGTPTPAK
jgi:hypothetical protein